MVDPLIRDAIVFGNIMVMLSIGLTLTYMTTKVPNFAHGIFATVGAYVTYSAGAIWGWDPARTGLSPYYALPLAFLLAGGVALFTYKAILGPLARRGASLVALMIATLATEIVIFAFINIYADYINRTFRIFSRQFIMRAFDFSFLDEPGLFVVTPVLIVGLVVSLYLLLTRTKFGVAMRATVENPALAGVLGVNVSRVYTISWFLAGGLAGVAGGLIPFWVQAGPATGTAFIVSIFAASILGGLGSIYGAVVGGYVVGLAEVYGTYLLANTVGTYAIPYRPAIPLAILVITLFLVPQGLTGLNWRQLWVRLRR